MWQRLHRECRARSQGLNSELGSASSALGPGVTPFTPWLWSFHKAGELVYIMFRICYNSLTIVRSAQSWMGTANIIIVQGRGSLVYCIG